MAGKRLIDCDRLFAAADLLLATLHSEQDRRSLLRACIVPGDQEQPAGGPFTLRELSEAMAMLIRMGLVVSTKPQAD